MLLLLGRKEYYGFCLLLFQVVDYHHKKQLLVHHHRGLIPSFIIVVSRHVRSGVVVIKIKHIAFRIRLKELGRLLDRGGSS